MPSKKKPVDEPGDQGTTVLSDLQAGDIFHMGDDSYRLRRLQPDGSGVVVRLEQVVIGVQILTLPGDTKVIEP